MPSELIPWHMGVRYDIRSNMQGPGYLQTASNVTFKTEGTQTLRPSFQAVNSTAVASMHSIRRFRDLILIAHGKTLSYRSALTSGDFTNLTTAMDNNPWKFHVYKDFLHGVNGKSSALLDASGNLYPGTISNPSTACACAEGAAGNPSGIYRVYVTFLYTFPNGAKYETGFSLASSDITVEDKKIEISSIPTSTYTAYSGTAPTIHRKLYIGPGSGGSLADIYYMTVLEDNTTTTYSYNDTDATVGANDASTVDDFEEAPQSKYLAYHYGRCFMIKLHQPHRLYYSETVSGADADENEVLMPLGFEDTNWDDLRVSGFGDVDPQGLVAWGTFLYIPLKQTWIKKYSNDPDVWSFRKTWSDLGIGAPYSIAISSRPVGIIGVSNPTGGIPCLSLFNGQTSENVSSPQFDYIFEDHLNQDSIDKCRGEFDGRYYHLLYPSGSNTEPDMWAAFDFSRYPDIRLAYWENLNGRCMHVDDQTSKIYIGGSDGYVRENTSGETIDADIQTHTLIGGDPKISNKLKKLRELKYALNTAGRDVNLEIWIDGERAKWMNDSYVYDISGTDDSVQYIKSLPQHFKGYEYSIRVTGAGLSTFEIFSPWEMKFDI